MVQQPTHQPTHKISGADLASYQFPVDDDEEEEEEEEVGDTSDGPVAQHTPSHPSLNKQPCASALKKSPSDGGVSSMYVCRLILSTDYMHCQCALQWVEGLGWKLSGVYGTGHSHCDSAPSQLSLILRSLPIYLVEYQYV